MIIDAIFNLIIDIVSGLITGILALLPDPPAWLGEGTTKLGWLLGHLYAFDAWIPVTLAMSCAGLVISIWLVAVTIDLIRMAVSYFAMGGGAR